MFKWVQTSWRTVLILTALFILLPGLLGLANHMMQSLTKQYAPTLTPYVQQTTNALFGIMDPLTQWLEDSQASS